MNTQLAVRKAIALLLLLPLMVVSAKSQATCVGCQPNSIAEIGDPGTTVFPCGITMQFSAAGTPGECVQVGTSCNDDLMPCHFVYFLAVTFNGNPGSLGAGFRVRDADDPDEPTHQAEGYNVVPIGTEQGPIAANGEYDLYCGSTAVATLTFTPSNGCAVATKSIHLVCSSCLLEIENPH